MSKKETPAQQEHLTALMGEWMKLTQNGFATAERWVALHYQLARTVVEHSVRGSQALAETSDPQQQRQRQQELAQQFSQQVMSAMNEAAQLMVKSQAEMNQFVIGALEKSTIMWRNGWTRQGDDGISAPAAFPWPALASTPWGDPAKTLQALEEASRMTTEMWQRIAGHAAPQKS